MEYVLVQSLYRGCIILLCEHGSSNIGHICTENEIWLILNFNLLAS